MSLYKMAQDAWNDLNATPERVHDERMQLTEAVRLLGGQVNWYPAVSCDESQRDRLRAECFDNLVKCRRLLREALEAAGAAGVSERWARDVQKELQR